MDAIVQAAKLHGWMVAHFRPALTAKGWRTPMQGDPGFPDLVLSKADRPTLFLELKSEKGTHTQSQRAWQKALGDNYRVIYPRDLGGVLNVLDILG